MGLVLTFVGFVIVASTAFFASVILIYLGLIILNIGDGLFEPAEASLISAAVGPQMQGRVSGANQGMQSVARIIGPFFAAYIYRYFRGLPYMSEAVLVSLSLLVFIFSFSVIRRKA